MILQTGGVTFGEISTRSMPASMAILTAVTVSMVPWLRPSWSISWICALRMSSLMRGPSLATAGGALLGRRMGSSPGLLKGRRYFEARHAYGQAESHFFAQNGQMRGILATRRRYSVTNGAARTRVVPR